MQWHRLDRYETYEYLNAFWFRHSHKALAQSSIYLCLCLSGAVQIGHNYRFLLQALLRYYQIVGEAAEEGEEEHNYKVPFAALKCDSRILAMRPKCWPIVPTLATTTARTVALTMTLSCYSTQENTIIDICIRLICIGEHVLLLFNCLWAMRLQ